MFVRMNDDTVLTGSGLDIDLLARVAQRPRRRFAGRGGARAGGRGARGGRARRGGRAAHLRPQYRTRRQSQASSRAGRDHRVPDAIRRRSRDRRRRAAAARHRACGDAGARQCDGAGRSGRVAGGARPPHRAPQPRRDTGRAALGLDRRRRPRSARAHRARDHRARMRRSTRAACSRAPRRCARRDSRRRHWDRRTGSRCATATRCPRGWPGSRCTPRGACCARPSARRRCRSKATPPIPTIFDPRLAAARPAFGQVAAAQRFRALLAGSSLYDAGAARSIQDALSFRCLSQVHGAAHDALERAVAACELELNAAADNPLVLAADDEMLSTGNFHLMALALAGRCAGDGALVGGGDGGRQDRQADAGRAHATAAVPVAGRRSVGRTRVDAENGRRAVRRNSPSRESGVPRSVRRQRDGRGPQRAGAARLRQARGPGARRWSASSRWRCWSPRRQWTCASPRAWAPRRRPLHAAIRAAVPPLDDDRECGADVEKIVTLVRARRRPNLRCHSSSSSNGNAESLTAPPAVISTCSSSFTPSRPPGSPT